MVPHTFPTVDPPTTPTHLHRVLPPKELQLTFPPGKHRGYAFITFANPADAQDAIDNYDLNELPGYRGQGKFLKCSIAAPNKFGNVAGSGNKFDRALWESEEWLKTNAGVEDGTEAAPAAANGE